MWFPESTSTNFDGKELETSLDHVVPDVFQHLELFGRGSQMWQTDGDRQTYVHCTEEPLAVTLLD